MVCHLPEMQSFPPIARCANLEIQIADVPNEGPRNTGMLCCSHGDNWQYKETIDTLGYEFISF